LGIVDKSCSRRREPRATPRVFALGPVGGSLIRRRRRERPAPSCSRWVGRRSWIVDRPSR